MAQAFGVDQFFQIVDTNQIPKATLINTNQLSVPSTLKGGLRGGIEKFVKRKPLKKVGFASPTPEQVNEQVKSVDMPVPVDDDFMPYHPAMFENETQIPKKLDDLQMDGIQTDENFMPYYPAMFENNESNDINYHPEMFPFDEDENFNQKASSEEVK